jgi:nucleotide-binding universal stress UspA family protein
MINLKSLLLPTDFSESARHAFTYALSFAREYKAELHLVHVLEVVPMGYSGDLFPSAMTEVSKEITGYAEAELGKLAEEARAAGVNTHIRIERGRPATEIIRVAAEDEIDMIVIGTHGRGVLSHVLFGSTTERVVRKAPCPVLICRLREREFVN